MKVKWFSKMPLWYLWIFYKYLDEEHECIEGSWVDNVED